MSSPDDAQPQPGSANPPARRLRLVPILVLLFVLAYGGAVLAYRGSGGSTMADAAQSVDNGVDIQIELIGMDPARNQMTLRIFPIPRGSYFNDKELTWRVPVRLTVWQQTNAAFSKTIEADTPIGGAEYNVYIQGNSLTYPFDRYEYELSSQDEDLDDELRAALRQDGATALPFPLVTIYKLDANGKAILPVDDNERPVPGAEVPIGYDTPVGLQGWSEQWNMTVYANTLAVEATIKRSGGVLTFVLVVLTLMIVIGVLAVTVSSMVARRRRPLEPTMAGWFAALLFALIPLRNYLPGSPPVGAWIDVLVFYWVEVAILASMAVFIGSWLRFRRMDIANRP